jgi:hypothetical protein
MSNRLPRSLTVSLNEDETTMSFISRVAFLNKRPAKEFCRDVGILPGALAMGDRDAINRLAQVTSADPEAITDRVFIKTERNRYRFKGECVAVQGLDFDGFRYCPACLKEDLETGSEPELARPYRRSSWVFSSYRVCSKHGMPLVGGDGSALDFAASLHANLETLRIAPVLTREACGFETYVDGRLRAGTSGGHWLDQFRIDAAGRICEIVGATELFPGRYISSLDKSEVRVAQNWGFDTACGGASAVRELLERVQQNAELPPVTPLEAWPALHLYLRGSSDTEYDALRDVAFNMSVSTMPYGEGDICMGRKVDDRVIHSVHTAAKQIKAHPNRLRRLLEKGGLVPQHSTEFHKERVLFRADTSAEFLELVAESMPWQAAVRYLNLPPRYDRRLLGEEFVAPLVKTSDGPLTQYVFPKRRLDAFISKLTAKSSALGRHGDRFMDIRSAAQRTACHEYDIVRMLFTSQLIDVRIDPNERAYRAILVDPDEVNRVSRRLHGMTKRQAGKTIRTRSTVVDALIDSGIIETFICERPTRGRRRIALVPESVERFAERYVSWATLSIKTGKHHTALKQALDQSGIEPAFPKELLHAQFYERERVRGLI